MTRGLVLALGLFACSNALASGVSGPCAATSTVRPVIVTPEGSLIYEVIVRDQYENPVPGALVTLGFNAAPAPNVLWCDSSVGGGANVSNFLCGLTGADGVARFRLYGGANLVPDPSNYVTVMASVMPVELAGPGEVGMVSTDPVDTSANPAPDGSVTTADAAFFTPIFAYAPAYDYQGDLNGDGKIGLVDLMMLIPDIQAGAYCRGASNQCTP